MSKKTNKVYSKQNKTVIAVVLSAVLVIAAVWLLIIFAPSSTTVENNDTPVFIPENVVQEQIERTLSGLSEEEDKRNALDSLLEVLNILLDLYDGVMDPEEFVTGIGLHLIPLPNSITEYLRFSTEFTNDPDELAYRTLAAQSLAALALQLNQLAGIEEIIPLHDNSWREIFLDQELGIAFIPISTFSPTDGNLAINMVLVGERWQVLPYSLLNSFLLLNDGI